MILRSSFWQWRFAGLVAAALLSLIGPAIAQQSGKGASSRLPVPDQASQEKAAKVVDDVFDFRAARTPEKRRELIQEIVSTARDSSKDPAAQYVMLQRARKMAAGIRDHNVGPLHATNRGGLCITLA